MADKVHITKGGIQALKWDSDVRQYVEQKIGTGVHVLRCACHIDPDVTLADIFRAVEQDPDFVRFLSSGPRAAWVPFTPRHVGGDRGIGLSYIEIAKYFEWDEHEVRISPGPPNHVGTSDNRRGPARVFID